MAPSPARLLERLCALHERATARVDGPIELYHRHATSVRVALLPGVDTPEVQSGAEDGTALRAWLPSEGAIAFAAASGCGAATVDGLVAAASAAYPHRGPFGEETPWQETEDRVADADPELRLPTAAELTRWLEVARAALPLREREAGREARRPAEPLARVEAAALVETWVASGGRRASRSRLLAWAVAEPPGAAGWGAGPLVLAARSWDRLSPEGWAGLAADRVWPARVGSAADVPPKLPVFFSPEASATVVSALVTTLHGLGAETEVAVGPGWRIRDDPFREGAPKGRAFDDACFDTHPRWLADGESVVGLLGGPGSWHRESYRDLPRPLATHVVVEPPPTGLPSAAILVHGVRVHALGPRDWIVELRGGLLRDGEPGPALDRAAVRTTPADLAARCVAGLGPAQTGWRNVTTPALLFDALPVTLLG